MDILINQIPLFPLLGEMCLHWYTTIQVVHLSHLWKEGCGMSYLSITGVPKDIPDVKLAAKGHRHHDIVMWEKQMSTTMSLDLSWIGSFIQGASAELQIAMLVVFIAFLTSYALHFFPLWCQFAVRVTVCFIGKED